MANNVSQECPKVYPIPSLLKWSNTLEMDEILPRVLDYHVLLHLLGASQVSWGEGDDPPSYFCLNILKRVDISFVKQYLCLTPVFRCI